MSAINGLSVGQPKQEVSGWDKNDQGAEIEATDHAIIERSNISLANMFFKVSISAIKSKLIEFR